MATFSSATVLTPAQGYQLWAGSYDRDPNPMLSLERRLLTALVPPFEGRDVVDVGCGTGYWLEVAERRGARNLVGIDPSEEMLAVARAKLGPRATLLCSDYASASLPEESADLLLANFVLSYVDDLPSFWNFAIKVLRPTGALFLSDVHPETARQWNWRRGVNVDGEFQQIRTFEHSIDEIIRSATDAGFILRARLEPSFGAAEGIIFEENGKAPYFETIRRDPAIYLLQVTPAHLANRVVREETTRGRIGGVSGARLAIGETDALHAELRIVDSHIDSLRVARSGYSSEGPAVDLSGYLVLPGLINAHDHLEFALFPRLGRGNYRNFVAWAEDIHRTHAEEIARHRTVPKPVRLWWGGIRNLLCGVTTVCHHNPRDPEVFNEQFPVRVLKDFAWAHSLQLDPEAAKKKRATPAGQRFFLHLAEGIDQQSRNEIRELHRQGALDDDTVIIHGLALDAENQALLRQSGASLVWCPSSNLFLFGQSLSSEQLDSLPNVALGSDSPLTADGDLLDEIRCAHQVLGMQPTAIYDYVTKQAAHVAGVKDGEGTLRAGATADFIAVRDTGRIPADALAEASYRDVELVVLAGRVQMASPEIKQRLPEHCAEGLQALSVEGTIRWIHAPLDRLFAQTLEHLHGPIYLGGKQVSRAC